MAEIRWTETAANWVRDIHEYISLDNADAAENVVAGIYNKIQELAKFPLIGHLYRTKDDDHVRILLFVHNRIAYLYRSEEDIVFILGIFHGAMEISRYLP